MFFLKDMTHTIQLPPSYFGPGIRKFVEQKLHKDVEGTCSDQYGYIISVVSISKVSQGKLIPGAGQAEYTVSYSAVVLKPFKGEVLDAIVISITKTGFFAEMGPLKIFVSLSNIPEELEYNAESSSFQSEDQVIENGSPVRLKILGIRTDATELYIIGTIKEDYLGAISF